MVLLSFSACFISPQYWLVSWRCYVKDRRENSDNTAGMWWKQLIMNYQILVAYSHLLRRLNTCIDCFNVECKPEIAQYSPYYLPLNVFTASKGSNLYILFAITAAGVVPCGGRKKSPRTSSIVQIIFLFRSFEISKDIQSVQNTHV